LLLTKWQQKGQGRIFQNSAENENDKWGQFGSACQDDDAGEGKSIFRGNPLFQVATPPLAG